MLKSSKKAKKKKIKVKLILVQNVSSNKDFCKQRDYRINKWYYKCNKKIKTWWKTTCSKFSLNRRQNFKILFTNFSKNKSRPSRYFPESDINELILFDEYKNKVFRPSKKEIDKNARSRSAKLRYAIRSENKFDYPTNLLKKFKKYLDVEAIDV